MMASEQQRNLSQIAHLLIACRFQARLAHKPPGEEDTIEDRLSR
jgi:hypothetical protein